MELLAAAADRNACIGGAAFACSRVAMLLAPTRQLTRLGSPHFLTFCRHYCANNMPSAILVLAGGAEEMEAVISVDVMRRGGIDVTVAGLEGPEPVTCSRNITIKPDISFDDAVKKDYDAVVLPGGMPGSKTLATTAKVGELLKKQESRGAIVAAICAAPIALEGHGIGKGKNLTSHPGVKDQLTGSYKYQEDRVVVDGKMITSRGPGTAFEFGLALVEALQGKEKKDSIVPPMLLK